MLWPRSVTGELKHASALEQRAVAAYWGMAIGDALGATVEFLLPNEIQAKHGVHDKIIGGGWLHLKKGEVTDDTTMALALGDAILEAGGIEGHTIGRHFDNWMKAKPVDIGNTVRHGILRFRNKGVLEAELNEYDGGNGACMRTLPLALATFGGSKEEMIAASRVQGRLTHNNPQSDSGTECVNEMLWIALDGGRLDCLIKPVEALIAADGDFRYRRKRQPSNPSGYIVDTLRVVFWSLFNTDSFEACLIDCVNRGGDADTTGAIVGAIAGALYGLEGIPSKWLRALNSDVKIQCRDQALALINAAPLGRVEPREADADAETEVSA
ncbi:ADP-ribosyl-[dinitrogen reductase] hydrolase [Magnetofaba australis]|uniref:Putative ADP-ribosyl-(Dinitrogen reductase) hydrolase DraG n=1 Tax=Magnetofaba australis IT-1 TaxID=1434232 RepID=A0A1Y2K2F9_9PROT|nr:ADP-ribosyl-[dinitrogen reductase] hydrolase [Magnetofaba australis]OSM02218.1 putative ADP-ribosyl-(dinitrogen reductase) hydrolase DraG [Magnetofaba australis IT-1]